MALDSLCSDIDSFLNSLGDAFPQLLGPAAASLLQQRETALSDINLVVLYGNATPILHKYMYELYGVHKVRDDITTVGDDEIQYSHSENHIEVYMTQAHMAYVRGVVKNKNINNKRFVFLIKGCTIANRSLQASFKRMFERYNAVFVFAARSLSNIAPEIIGMSFCVKCNFPRENVVSHFSRIYHEDPKDIAEIHDTHNDIINTVLAIKNGIKKTLMHGAFERFFNQLSKEKNSLGVSAACRDFAHRLFHINMPFAMLVQHVVRAMRTKGAEKQLSAVIECAARCDHLASISKKTILLYERFLLDVSQIV